MNSRRIIQLYIIGILMFALCTTGEAQKEKSGHKPHFTNWSRGKDFKYLTRKSKNLGLDKGPKYLFIGEAKEVAYYREKAKEYGYRALEVVEEAEDDARIALALLLNTSVESSAKKSTTLTGLERQRFNERFSEVSTKAKFAGFTKVGSYWQKEKAEGGADYHAWVLFSYTEDKLKDILAKYADALGVPDLAGDVLQEIQTTSEDLDDVDDSQFNFN